MKGMAFIFILYFAFLIIMALSTDKKHEDKSALQYKIDSLQLELYICKQDTFQLYKDNHLMRTQFNIWYKNTYGKSVE